MNTNNTQQSSSRQNQVSPVGGGGSNNDSASSSFSTLQSPRRKRKQEALTSSVPDTVASLAEPTIAAETIYNLNIAADHLTDEQKITTIVTKQLLKENVDDVTKAMDSLNTLVFSTPNKDENRKTAVRRGAFLGVVQAMDRNGNSHNIQSLGIQFLNAISCCQLDNFKKDIIAVGGLTCCLNAMKCHSNDTEVQSYGCLLIGNLWGDPEFRKMVVDEGGLKAIVKAMEEHEEDTYAQSQACYALMALLLDDYSWSKTVVDAGSITLVMTAMNKHPHDAEVQMDGCAVLYSLSKAHEDYRSMILDAKGLVPIVEAQRIHKHNAQVKHVAREAHDAIIA